MKRGTFVYINTSEIHISEGDHFQCNLIKPNDRKKLAIFLRCNYFRFVYTRHHKAHLKAVDLLHFVSDSRKQAKSKNNFNNCSFSTLNLSTHKFLIPFHLLFLGEELMIYFRIMQKKSYELNFNQLKNERSDRLTISSFHNENI